jgi:hypothetical protein
LTTKTSDGKTYLKMKLTFITASPRRPARRGPVALVVLAGVLAAGGCDETRAPGGLAAPGTAAPLYLLAGTIFGTADVSYVVPTRSLAPGTTLDYDKALELPGGAGVYGPERAGHFFVGAGDSPTLTRYEVSAEGSFTRGETLSFANHGLTNALVNNGGVVFLSPSKAYFIHQEDLKAVVWNPASMQIEGDLALPPELRKEGFVVVFDGKAQRQGNDLHLVASWADHTNGRYPPGALVVTIDTATDEVVAQEADGRCSQVFDSMRHPSGDIYYACSPWSAATHRALGADFAAESCLLRIRRGQRRFDPDFHVRLPALTGGQVAGTLIPGQGAEGFVRVLDESLFPVVPGATVRDLTGAEAWRWWRLDLDALMASPSDLAPSAAGATELQIDGVVYTSLSKQDFSETTLIEMTAPGGPRPGLAARGYLHNGLRVH